MKGWNVKGVKKKPFISFFYCTRGQLKKIKYSEKGFFVYFVCVFFSSFFLFLRVKNYGWTQEGSKR